MIQADLHIHTHASDGDHSPEEIVRLAKEKGLLAIGITDHDSVGGIEAALAAGKKLGLHVVPGLELSVDIPEGEIHLLGYLIDHTAREITSTLKNLQKERQTRVELMVRRLNSLDYPITLEEVGQIAGNGSPGRLHIARALVERKLVPSVNAAFAQLLGRGRPAYVPRQKLNLREAIDLIQDNGGVAVLAHPGLLQNDPLVTRLMELPIDGLEVYHPENTPAQRVRYRQLCQERGLLITGGSDYHGPRAKEGIALGETGVSLQELKRLYAKRGIPLTIES